MTLEPPVCSRRPRGPRSDVVSEDELDLERYRQLIAVEVLQRGIGVDTPRITSNRDQWLPEPKIIHTRNLLFVAR